METLTAKRTAKVKNNFEKSSFIRQKFRFELFYFQELIPLFTAIFYCLSPLAKLMDFSLSNKRISTAIGAKNRSISVTNNFLCKGANAIV